MTPAEVAVLAALHPDRTLTAIQIQRDSALTSWHTRNALARLQARGLILPGHIRGRWRITARGRIALGVKRRRFG
ncbi:hypothetical protein OHB26_23805 [Nocardia sp. NBC_01503]|uniref:hypothetical protein n=1 Tax=Nocardia sp. NBC_01503 TaxID=2975997 RepID=UPI002E7B82C5|nr:hypothetical protein [Nocardia sp. NBC_01503]WTL29983.1 hypothetical protein OHB26_23805 [Nocardia sp. NBC_01503]